ncbi:MAG: carboxylating nicotinate-nucleotide diphosphorylase [Candidatus Omnitrophica bacterium]|nr:carboxylating nicotinate-nucleotide diphosphorylase [Candidatus Omnitrophota bacterium]
MQEVYFKNIVKLALAEDLGSGDVTSNSLIPAKAKAQARLIFKSDGVVCGLNVAEAVFKTLHKGIVFHKIVHDGCQVKKGTAVAVIKGSARAILSAERVAINFLTHLSSIATKTRMFVDSIQPYSSKIYDTRKTTPLLRHFERYAVKMGGGVNHRFDLSEMGMIKDNHRSMLRKGGLKESVQFIKDKTHKKVVLEVDTWDEFQEALTSKADVILLDNMRPTMVRKAVVLRNKVNPEILLEASGGINLENVRAYAETGVERISVGSLTSIKSGVDISLDFIA